MTKSFYNLTDSDWEKVLLEHGALDELFYVKDLEQRKMFVGGDIDQDQVGGVCRNIMQFNADDKGVPVEERKPILLYIVSNGGEVDAGFELIDTILSSNTPVYTINLGYQYSMGFLIGLAGHKRFAMKNAKYLMHDGSNFVYNSGAKAQDQMEFNRRVEDRIKRYVVSKTKISPELYDERERVEWYMFADEAKSLGVTDFIIGEDCGLDEII